MGIGISVLGPVRCWTSQLACYDRCFDPGHNPVNARAFSPSGSRCSRLGWSTRLRRRIRRKSHVDSVAGESLCGSGHACLGFGRARRCAASLAWLGMGKCACNHLVRRIAVLCRIAGGIRDFAGGGLRDRARQPVAAERHGCARSARPADRAGLDRRHARLAAAVAPPSLVRVPAGAACYLRMARVYLAPDCAGCTERLGRRHCRRTVACGGLPC